MQGTHEIVRSGDFDGLIPRIGIDLGGVVLAATTDRENSIFSGHGYLNVKLNDGAVEAISAMAHDFSGDNIFFVSKCGPVVQERSMEVLEKNDFFRSTGTSPSNVRFCREISEKAVIADALRLSHFIDDRLKVLLRMRHSGRTLLLFEAGGGEIRRLTNASGVRHVVGWQSAYYAVKESIANL